MLKFFKCKKCGKIVEIVNEGCPVIVCCGDEMVELKANTTDGAAEKHVPVIEKDGENVKVKVGSAVHPMEDVHYIQWITIETDKGIQRKKLNPGENPEATFVLAGEKLVAAYEYCNKHGLWKAEA
ncbi:MAG: desulfoferrodoxin [Treponema sp.]|nr:desulfoferrodoxin [Treponema sp.]MBR1714568.1 desulfoferrodoxin [Treponema sp.]